MGNVSIYIHYPFCRSKCPYCDFNSYCDIKVDEAELLDGYLAEIERYRNILENRNIETIYFGGGTPSLMASGFLGRIMDKISSIGNIASDCEVSMEANPNSIGNLEEFKSAGINRLSIGVQSLLDRDLKMLGRIHDRAQALGAIKSAQKVFGDRYSIDMIYTRPNQDLDEWRKELEEAIGLSPYHMSLYQLIIEKSTPFGRNKVKLPDDDSGVDFYNITRDILEKNGLNFYEISNYARGGHECRHNMVYWTNGEWLGIGAGAHGRINDGRKRYATQNLKNPIDWLQRVKEKGIGTSSKKLLTEREIIEEFVLMGLRIKDGIKIKDLQKNIDVDSFYDVLNDVDFLVKNNFIEADGGHIRVKKDAFLLLNSVIGRLL